MAYCAKCGKETKDGQIYCESCLAEMEDNSYDDLFESLNEKEPSDNAADDDFTKILEDLQGPREEIEEPKEKKTDAPSTVSDVFSDAVSAISSLEDELGDMMDLGKTEEQKEEKEQKKKESFLKRLFRRKSKQADADSDEVTETEKVPDTKAELKAQKKAKKQEAKLAKEEAKAAKKKEAKESKAKTKPAKSAKEESESDDPKKAKAKKAKAKKEKAKKAEPKKAKKEKPKKEKPKKKKPDAEEVIVEEDLGHFSIPVMVIVFAVFILGTGYILIQSLTTSYHYSIEVASRKFENQKYNQAFEEIYGLNVRKDDEKLYDKIMTVMYVNKQLNSYNNYMALNMYPEALDSLVKGLKRYEKYLDAAEELGITDDLDYVRGQILKVLKKEFGLSEKKAMKLTKIEDKSKYSIEIYDIVIENTDYVNK